MWRNRRAKIVATLGPSSWSEQGITQLIELGLDVARINMSHGDYDTHAKTIRTIRECSKKMSTEVAILLDLQGPKIRVEKLTAPLVLQEGQLWFLGAHGPGGRPLDRFIPTSYKHIVEDLKINDRILFDDGMMDGIVTGKHRDVIEFKVINGGALKSNKGINLPDSTVSIPAVTEKDKEDLSFGIANEVDFVAISFVSNSDDVVQVKNLIAMSGAKLPVIAKIERPQAISNIDKIIAVSDAILIARGDMGVELGNHLVPRVQKMIINKCNNVGVPVITATQMLESMIHNPRPTRAEASDVANAIWDGSDAVMLSGETAAGQFPFEAFKTMSMIVEEAEKSPKERPLMRHMPLGSLTEAIQVGASLVAEKTNAKALICVTESGNSALKLSRFRSRIHVLAVTNSLATQRRMNLYWGIRPFLFSGPNSMESVEWQMLDRLREDGLVYPGESVVITRGDGEYFTRGSSNSLRVETIRPNDAHS